jgi:methylmalonyl-CoA mutase N-terminal domain/subunit
VEARGHALDALTVAAQSGGGNLLSLAIDAMRARATVGEVSDALRDVWGVYTPTDAF